MNMGSIHVDNDLKDNLTNFWLLIVVSNSNKFDFSGIDKNN